MKELFTDIQMIDPNVFKGVKMYKKAGWEIDEISSFFESLLKTHDQENKIPWIREQIRLVKENWKELKKIKYTRE